MKYFVHACRADHATSHCDAPCLIKDYSIFKIVDGVILICRGMENVLLRTFIHAREWQSRTDDEAFPSWNRLWSGPLTSYLAPSVLRFAEFCFPLQHNPGRASRKPKEGLLPRPSVIQGSQIACLHGNRETKLNPKPDAREKHIEGNPHQPPVTFNRRLSTPYLRLCEFLLASEHILVLC